MLRARTRSIINLAGRAHTIAAVAQTAHTNNLCVANPHLLLHSSSSSFDDTFDSG